MNVGAEDPRHFLHYVYFGNVSKGYPDRCAARFERDDERFPLDRVLHSSCLMVRDELKMHHELLVLSVYLSIRLKCDFL